MSLAAAQQMVRSGQAPILLVGGQSLTPFDSPPPGGVGQVGRYWRFSFSLVNGGPTPALSIDCILDLAIAQHGGASAQLAMVPPGDNSSTQQTRTVSFDVPEATVLEAFNTKQTDGYFGGMLHVRYNTPTGYYMDDKSVFTIRKRGDEFQFAANTNHYGKDITGLRHFA